MAVSRFVRAILSASRAISAVAELVVRLMNGRHTHTYIYTHIQAEIQRYHHDDDDEKNNDVLLLARRVITNSEMRRAADVERV